LSIVTHTHSFIVVRKPDEIAALIEETLPDFLSSLPNTRIIEKKDRRIIIEASFRKGFSRVRERIVVEARRVEGGSLQITGIGEHFDFTITISFREEFPHTRVNATATIRGSKPKSFRPFIADLLKRLERHVKTTPPPIVKPKPAAKPAQPTPRTVEAVSEQPKPAEKPLVEEQAKPPAEKEELPKPPIPRDIENRMLDPLWMASLLMKTELIIRRKMGLPGSPKELLDTLLSQAGERVKEYPAVMLSLRGGDQDAHIIVDPRSLDIIGAKITIGGILDYTGEQALRKLFENKGSEYEVKLWGIKGFPS
jgi:hypothetical protein